MNVKKLVIINIVSLLVLVGGGFAAFYFYNQSANYIKTDYAKIDGHKYAVVSSTPGLLTKWNGKVGTHFAKGDAIGEVAVSAPTKKDPAHMETTQVTAPNSVTVVANNAVKDTPVAAGTPLAYAYDLDNLYITANIEETKIDDIELGKKVDLTVDSFKDVKFEGKVIEIGKAAASEFSLLPQGNSNANYTKVTQVIPVKISLEDAKGYDILPGMSVSVRIHK